MSQMPLLSDGNILLRTFRAEDINALIGRLNRLEESIAEIEEDVALEAPVEAASTMRRRVRSARQAARKKCKLRLVAERSAGEKRAHRALRRAHALRKLVDRSEFGLHRRRCRKRRRAALRERDRHVAGMPQ